jgi:hypothetical protein
MKSINDINEAGDDLALVPAAELRDMTITEEEMYTRDKSSLLQSLMSTMVSKANNNGVFGYSASVNPKIDRKLLSEIKDQFSELGYSVEVEEVKTPTLGEQVVLHISWEKK